MLPNNSSSQPPPPPPRVDSEISTKSWKKVEISEQSHSMSQTSRYTFINLNTPNKLTLI